MTPYEGAIGCAPEEASVDRRVEERLTPGAVKIPEPLRLLRGEPKPRHLQVLAAYSEQCVVRHTLLPHVAGRRHGRPSAATRS